MCWEWFCPRGHQEKGRSPCVYIDPPNINTAPLPRSLTLRTQDTRVAQVSLLGRDSLLYGS